MNKIYRPLLIIIFLLQVAIFINLNSLSATNQPKPKKKMDFVEDEVLVKYRNNIPEKVKKKIETHSNASRVEEIGFVKIVKLKVPKGTVLNKVNQLQNNKEVVFAEPNFIKRINTAPNDPQFANQWGLNNSGQRIKGSTGVEDADIDALQGWAKTKGSSSTKIAVVDTGIQWSHPDLIRNIWANSSEVPGNGIDDDLNGFIDDYRGWDFYHSDDTVYDGADDYHGTHVAGIIGASANNAIGVTGINWSVKIMPVKFLGDGGFGTVDDEIKALGYAADNGAGIINASYGSSDYSKSEYEAINALKTRGILFVAAAGNWSDNNDAAPVYPASYGLPNIISVGSSNNKDEKSYFTNTGVNTVDIFAPGSNILSTYPTGKYDYLSGTSMAAPFITGSAGLVLSLFGGSFAEVKTRILQSSDAKSPFAKRSITGGRLNVLDALRNKQPSITQPLSGQVLRKGGGYRFKWNTGGVSHLKYRVSVVKKVNAGSIETFEKTLPKAISYKGFAPWSRTTSAKYNGNYSLISGKIGDSKSSSFKIRRYIPVDSYISFAYKVSSEKVAEFWSGDSLSFQVDSQTVFRASGFTGWKKKQFAVKKGWHTFNWIYAKDFSLFNGEDRAWVDDIRFGAKPRTTKSYYIGETLKGAASYYGHIPSSIASGTASLYVTGASGSKRTTAGKRNVVIE